MDENLLGRIAVFNKFVRQDQLDECLRIQRSQSPPRKLGEILIERGFLDHEQLQLILEIRRKRARKVQRKPEEARQCDCSFGRLSMEAGYIKLDDLEDAILEQQRLDHLNLHFRIGEILVAKSKMTLGDVLEVLRRQGKRILICPVCDIHYNVVEYKNGKSYSCAKCRAKLLEPKFLETVGADAYIDG